MPESVELKHHDRQSASEQCSTQFDSPWKDVLEIFFEEFMRFFFPQAHREIDWTLPFEFLDKEFQQALSSDQPAARVVDKLVKVWTTKGKESWVLIHIEIQNQRQRKFAERMFVYHNRIYDKYRQKIASVAVLGDKNLRWQPDEFKSQLWNCQILFKFHVIKLLNYKQQWSMLESSLSPFAPIIMAYIVRQETRSNPEQRLAHKLRLFRDLRKRGYEKDSVYKLFRLIDNIMRLPRDWENEFWQQAVYEDQKNMKHMFSFEKEAMKQGLKAGIKQEQERMKLFLLDHLKLQLEMKFGKESLELLPTISKFKTPEKLIVFQSKLISANNLKELRQELSVEA
jgi:hypothetical protein